MSDDEALPPLDFELPTLPTSPPPLDVSLPELPTSIRKQVEPILARMSTGAMRPEDWETLGKLMAYVEEHGAPDEPRG